MSDRQMPMPGDGVILNYSTFCVGPSAFGVLEGMVGELRDEYLLTFNASVFRDGSVSCSGGPGIYIPANRLWLIGEMDAVFWKWENGCAGAEKGREYELTVPLWLYDTREYSWLGNPEEVHWAITEKEDTSSRITRFKIDPARLANVQALFVPIDKKPIP